MKGLDIDISCHGGIKLGGIVTCDGFVKGFKYRVQTHVHSDHMNGFYTSKGEQDIIMSEATRDLLALDHYDIPFRNSQNGGNIIALPTNSILHDNNSTIELKSNNHMLGAVQVAVTTPEGKTVGYSSDFSWPLDEVIRVDSLVVDSTYGSPESIRRYSQEQANECFCEIVAENSREGPVIIYANRSTLFRALGLLDGLLPYPIIVSKRKIAEAKVHQKYGRSICPLEVLESPETRKIRKNGSYIELYYTNDQLLHDPGKCTVIKLTAFGLNNEPYQEVNSSVYNVGISDHADYYQTLEYIQKTGAKEVLTDPIHGTHAIPLAAAIKNKLGITAKVAKVITSMEWGV